ncbi:pyruvate kinase [Tessaracoccus sp. SD287]|uniref:pyruvate kinase n=1 Tax=Tessaracoccus sp. SD287 TaxID=2782008 RepID=UPI001A97CDC6|nr:pyruvate kinase [Tessaracoccus sp. SD287]
MRRAKIVCTLGPAVESPERMEGIINAGMNVARLNMSHGDYSEHAARYQLVRDTAERLGKRVAILADLQGPKIRLGKFANNEKHYLEVGQEFTITTDDIEGTVERCSTTFKGLPADVTVGDSLLIDDGKVMLEAIEVTGNDVRTKTVVPGYVSNNKGINLPGVAVNVPAMSEKDESDLRWALKQGVDLIALSFVRTGDDVKRAHEIMDEEGRRVPVVAKLEKPQAIENMQDIIDKFDAVMVARGDLGVELPLESVPIAQKRIVEAARIWAKPVIVATQMLESMTNNPRPTRAETSDVANAVIDGTDAVMLSGETSVGDFPVETVATMAKIVENVEAHGIDRIQRIDWDPHTTSGIMAKSATEVAARLDAKYLIAFTSSGDTARRLSRLRPTTPMLAFTPSKDTAQQLALSWGIESYVTDTYSVFNEMVKAVQELMLSEGLVEQGDRIVIVYGSPMGTAGKTNAIRVHKIGGALNP